MMIRSWRIPVCSASSADRRADSSIASIITSRASRGSASGRVDVHQLGQDGLVERPPVDPDPDGLVVVDGDPDDRREVLVVALGADVAGVDPVLGEGRGHLRVVHEQLVAVVVEVADDRDVDAEATDLADHLGDGGRRLVRVHGHPDQLRAGMRQAGDLDRGPVRIRGIRVGHRLDDDRMGAPDQDATDVHADRRPASWTQRVGRGHVPPPLRLRMMSYPVTQMRKAKRNTKPTM